VSPDQGRTDAQGIRPARGRDEKVGGSGIRMAGLADKAKLIVLMQRRRRL
jgi:hypothetical protein